MAENKPTNRERLREITDGIEQGIKELFELSLIHIWHRALLFPLLPRAQRRPRQRIPPMTAMWWWKKRKKHLR